MKKPRREGLKQKEQSDLTQIHKTTTEDETIWLSAVVTRVLCDSIHPVFTATTHPACRASRLVWSQFVEGVNLKAAS